MLKAVIWDMDGVIIDSEMAYFKEMFEFAKSKNPSVKIEDMVGVVGKIRKDSWTIVEKAVNNGQTWEELHDEFLPRWPEIYKEVDYKAIFRPEAMTAMEAIKAMGLIQAVASSTEEEHVRYILGLNDVLKYMETVLSGSNLKRSKPDPAIYLKTAEILGVEPSECLVVEDSTAGITAGHRAGMTVAAIVDDRFGFDRSLADYEIKSLDELETLIKEIR